MRQSYLLLLALLCLAIKPIQAQQVSLTTPNGSYAQDFNTLVNTGTSAVFPTGWIIRETGTAAAVDGQYVADNGGSGTGNAYSYGASASTERALGCLLSGTLTPTLGVGFTNNTGAIINSITISYTGEQWRCGATTRRDSLFFQYSLDATDLATGTWTSVKNLDFASPNITATGAMSGNDAANRTLISFTISSLSIPAGSTFYFRWNDFNAASSDDGLAVDDFSINYTTGGSPGTTVSVATTTHAAEPATDGSFTITLSAASATDIIVDYDFTGSTATLDADFTDPEGGNILIPAGQLSAIVNIDVMDDVLPEATETITLNLTGATAPYTIAGSTASINLTSEDISTVNFTGTYFQDFNTLAATGTSSATPTGWTFVETGGNANLEYAAGNGSSNSGNTYSFGTGSDVDRAFGALRSGSLVPLTGALFTNNTGATVTSLSITYTGEQWRLGTENRNDRLDFQYSPSTTSITSGTWTDVDGLDFIAPNASGTVGPFDGNATGNRVTINYTINGLSIPAGAVFGIRWQDFDVTGAEDGLGIDDFTITLGCTPPTNQATALNLTPALQSISGNFTDAAAGTTPADAYLVLVSTAATLTEMPSSGTAYAIDDVIGNATVVSISGNTFTASGLTPSTTYYFFVFSTSAATNCYNTITPLTGNIATAAPPACTPPATQVSNLSTTTITSTSIDLTWTRGGGDNVLVIARSGEPVNGTIYNSIAYPTSTEIGSGNFVIYNGPASAFSYTSLTQNTTYHFALYEYNNTGLCYRTPALTGNFTTLCTNPENVTALTGAPGNTQVTVAWTLPSAACHDEIIVVASPASVTNTGDTYTAPANPAYTGGEQVVYRGTGTNVVVTGLTNGTTYYFKVFTRKGSNYSNGVQITAIPFNPALGYMYLYGNLHAHSSYSDGNKDNLSNTPDEDFAFARDALCMDFLGISEHNHAGAGMSYPDYAQGFAEANSLNGVPGPGGNSLVTLWGMEWGVINNGGHVLVYGFDDDLIGWESGNYDLFVAKNDYAALWSTINSRSGAFATLAHPNTTDYTNLAAGYNATADAAIVGAAIESGPAFSTSTTYNDFPSSLAFLSYYRNMLSKGYRLAPQMDQDNHNLTFGTANANRMVVLSSAKTREAVMEAIRSMRYYASQDCNVRIDFKNGTRPMGSQVVNSGVPVLTMDVTDPDAEVVTSIELWGGEVGAAVPATAIKTYNNTASFNFTSGDVENIQPNNTTWYYYAVITQEDGNKAVTASIWYTRNDQLLPVTLTAFRARYDEVNSKVDLSWTTAQENNSKAFVIEKSSNGINFEAIGTVKAAGNSNKVLNYAFIDEQPLAGNNFYRLQQVDLDGRKEASGIVKVAIEKGFYLTYGPNPATQYLTLNIQNNHAPLAVQLTDLNGRLLQQRNLPVSTSQTARFNVSNLARGVYLLKIAGNEGIKTEKIIVK